MKQNKEEQIKQTDELIKLGFQITELVKPIFDGEEYDDRINLSESVTQTIRKKRGEISKIDNDKENLILKIIGQMYNGVLVKDNLSFRNGEIFNFRCQNKPSVQKVKEILLSNIHEVGEKISPQNLDVIEVLLDKIYLNQNSSKDRWGNRDEKQRMKIINFPSEIRILEKNKDDYEEKNVYKDMFTIYKINGVRIMDDGDVEFFKDVVNEETRETEKEEVELENSTFAGLYLKFEKEINENAKEFINDLNREIKEADKEMEEIKLKGQNQLALCELQNVGNMK